MMGDSVGFLEIVIIIAFSTLFSVGGGNGPLAIIQDRWVNSGLLEPALFSWALALGYTSPGPKAGFLSAIGYYMYGLPGAFAAMIGVILPSLVGAGAVLYWFDRLQPAIKRISLPAGFVIAGMISAAAWKLAEPMALSTIELASIIAIAVWVVWRSPEPAIIVLGAAALGLIGWTAG
jgi:chromate transporter